MTKKDFKDTAAAQFVTIPNSGSSQQVVSHMTGSKTEEADFKFQVGRVEKAEAKTRKVQCLFRPSLYKKIEAKARELGLSVNELIHQVMNGYISKPKGIQ